MTKYGADSTPTYPTPSGAIFVATTGNDSTGTGTIGAPYRTAKFALTKVAAGGTVVLRGGEYHEGANYPNHVLGAVFVNASTPNVTIQNYNGEEVWFDGSVVVGGWAAYGTGKWRAPFAYSAYRDATNIRGESADANFYGSWTLPEFPISFWPEQVFIDGVYQTQVATEAEVVEGTFFVQGSSPATGVENNRFDSTHYVLGTNPTGKQVRISNLQRAFTSAADNCTVRGLNWRRYAPSIPDISAVYQNSRPGSLFENCRFEWISDCGLDVESPGWTIRKCTFLWNGREAIATGTHADNGLLEWCYFEGTNHRRFNYGPISGNIKLAAQWNTTIRWNRMHDTRTHGIWFDVCAYKSRIYGNYLTDTWGIGIMYEISGLAWITDNIIIDNGIHSTDNSKRRPHDGPAIDVKSSSDVHIWNNTIIGPEVGIRFSEGYRKPLNEDGVSWRTEHPLGAVFAQDKTRSQQFYEDAGFEDVWDFYRTQMTWTNQNTSLANNVFAGTAGISAVQSCFISYYCEDGTKNAVELTGQLNLPNVYARLDGITPARFANSIKRATTPLTPSLGVAYFNMTGAGHEGSPSWRVTMDDQQSTLVTSNIYADPRMHLLDRDGILKSAPVAVPPHEVQALLDISPFVNRRVGAGDPLVPGAEHQPFRDVRIGEDLAVAMFIGGVQAWPTV